jgi:hypothetical protein
MQPRYPPHLLPRTSLSRSMIEPATTNPLAYIVAQVAMVAELEPPAQALQRPAFGPREYLGALLEADQHADAVKFLAHLLPRREAVWWAWMCAKKGLGKTPLKEEHAALTATEKWIAEPTDENRRAALEAANAATLESPAGCAALAAFLTGGSLAPPGMAEVPPPRYAAAKAVFGSLVFSAVTVEPEKAPEKFRKYLSDGMELAERIALWESLDRAARAAVTA